MSETSSSLGALPSESVQRTGAQASISRIEEMVDFRRIFYLLLKRLWVIALVVIVGMIAVTAWVLRQPKIYESHAALIVEGQERKVLNSEDLDRESLSSSDFVNTVVQAITSSNILLAVIKANNLESDPNFVPRKPDGRGYTDAQLVVRMQRKVRVELRRQSRVIDITVEDQNPELACRLATSFVEEFLRESFRQRMMVSRVANEFLNGEADKLKKKLEESEQQLQQYKEQNNAVSLEQSQNIIVQTLQEVSASLTEAKNTRLKLEADLEQIKRTDPSDLDELLRIDSVVAIPQVVSARQDLMKAENDLASLKEHYLPKHPKYIAAMDTINGVKQSLKEAVAKAEQEISEQYDSARETESKMEESLKEQEAKALQLNRLSIRYNVLTREVQTDQALFDSVVSRMKETGVEEGVESAPYQVMEEPLVPSYPTKPKVLKTLLLAFIFLTVGSAAVVIILDGMKTVLRSVDDVEQSLQLPALTAVPEMKVAKTSFGYRLKRVGQIVRKAPRTGGMGRRILRSLIRSRPTDPREDLSGAFPIAAIDEQDSPAAEAYRTLRTSILLMASQETKRLLLFTSAIPEEGKTFTCINVAVTFAQQGERTLLVDADLRRPSIHHAMVKDKEAGGSEKHGLTDYLSGLISLDEAILPTRIEGLSLLPAGRRSPNPAELIITSDLVDLTRRLRDRFDRIIIDTSPINAVSDTLILAKAAREIILVVRADSTPRRAVTRAIKLLTQNGANVNGVVLNRLALGPSAGYYYYYYGDKYVKESAYRTNSKT